MQLSHACILIPIASETDTMKYRLIDKQVDYSTVYDSIDELEATCSQACRYAHEILRIGDVAMPDAANDCLKLVVNDPEEDDSDSMPASMTSRRMCDLISSIRLRCSLMLSTA